MIVDVQRLLDALEVHYKRRGDRLWARCPNPDHDDPVPSWMVWDDPGSRRHGRHRCYGCGLRGGPVELVMAARGVDAQAALEMLRTGDLEVSFLSAEVELVKHGFGRSPVVVPEGVRFAPLDEWPGAPRNYARERCLSAESVDRWSIGYAVDGDLAGRVVIPALDAQGDLVGYAARDFLGRRRKMMTPPKTGMQVPMGMHLWPSTESKPEPLVVVEGPFDGIAVDADVHTPVLVLQGSNPDDSVLALAASPRFSCVVLLTDPDKAGDRVAEQFGGIARWSRVMRVRDPEGRDPAKLHEDGALKRLLVKELRL